MINDDDSLRPKPRDYMIGQDVSAFSIADLDETSERLRAELERLAEIRARKQASAAAADALFRKG